MLRGITIQLVTQTEIEKDAFGHPIYEESLEDVENVLVGQPTPGDIPAALDLTGKKVVYTLGIPKGDAHDWEDRVVILPPPFSGKFKTLGFSVVGIEELVPLDWNRKVMVERYE